MVRGTLQNGIQSDSIGQSELADHSLLRIDSLGQSGAIRVAENDEDELSLEGILSFLKRRARILSVVTAVSTLGLCSLLLTKPPVYFGKFRLLVEPVTTGSQLAEDLTSDTVQSSQAQTRRIISGAGQSRIDYVSQIEVLRSEATMEPIVERIQKEYPEITYSTLISRLSIIRPDETKLLDFSYTSLDPDEIQFVLEVLSDEFIKYSIDDRLSNLKDGSEFIETQIQRQRSQLSALEDQLGDLRERYQIVNPENTETLLNNQLARLSNEFATTRVKLAEAQTLYANLRVQVGQEPSYAIALSNLSESRTYQNLLLELQEVDTQIASESTRFNSNALEIQILQDQRERIMPLLRAEAARVMGSAAVGNASLPSSLGYQGEISRDLTQQLVNATNQVQVLTQQDQVLQNAIQQVNQQTQSLSGIAQQYLKIVREVELASGSLTRLQIARENLQVESARQSAPWKLISKLGEGSIGVQGGQSKQLLLRLIASGALGVIAALIAEQLDRVFHDVEELKEISLPCLGIIPYNRLIADSESSLIAASGNSEVSDSLSSKERQTNALFQESFYTLDANIRLLSSDKPIKSLTITSTSPADGKSTISSHLAMAAVMMGRRVLLIDTDLRRPQIHSRFNVSNIQGLSSVLTSDIDFYNVIQPAKHLPGLSLLAAGPTPPSPGRLLSSRKMETLMHQATQDFDLVICDAPPAIFADSKLTATNTDGVLLVVGINKTDRPQALQVIEDWNTSSHASILGLVANGVKGKEMDSYYYQRYYSAEGTDTTKRNLLSAFRSSKK